MKSKLARQRRAAVEEIEPRILYSADFAPALADAPAFASEAEQRIVEPSGEFAQTTFEEARVHEIVFVDSATPDYARLIDDLRAQTGDRDIEVVLIGAGKDGIRDITQTLAGRQAISAVHIVSHGSDGSVQLGDSQLNFDSLLKLASKIKGWGSALTSDADILIYGGDVTSILCPWSRARRARIKPGTTRRIATRTPTSLRSPTSCSVRVPPGTTSTPSPPAS